MDAKVKITTPDDFDVTITLQMKVSELRVFRRQHLENPVTSNYPISILTRALGALSDQVDREYFPNPITVECRECGHEFEALLPKHIGDEEVLKGEA